MIRTVPDLRNGPKGHKKGPWCNTGLVQERLKPALSTEARCYRLRLRPELLDPDEERVEPPDVPREPPEEDLVEPTLDERLPDDREPVPYDVRELPLEGARTPWEELLEPPRTADSTTRLTVRLTPDPLLEDSRPDGATCIRLDPRDLVDESSEEPDEPRTDEPVLLDPPPERLGALVPELPDDRSTALLRVFPSVLPPL